jgi:hypothetical protein
VLAELEAVAKMVSDRCDRGQPPRATEGSVGLDLIWGMAGLSADRRCRNGAEVTAAKSS